MLRSGRRVEGVLAEEEARCLAVGADGVVEQVRREARDRCKHGGAVESVERVGDVNVGDDQLARLVLDQQGAAHEQAHALDRDVRTVGEADADLVGHDAGDAGARLLHQPLGREPADDIAARNGPDAAVLLVEAVESRTEEVLPRLGLNLSVRHASDDVSERLGDAVCGGHDELLQHARREARQPSRTERRERAHQRLDVDGARAHERLEDGRGRGDRRRRRLGVQRAQPGGVGDVGGGELRCTERRARTSKVACLRDADCAQLLPVVEVVVVGVRVESKLDVSIVDDETLAHGVRDRAGGHRRGLQRSLPQLAVLLLHEQAAAIRELFGDVLVAPPPKLVQAQLWESEESPPRHAGRRCRGDIAAERVVERGHGVESCGGDRLHQVHGGGRKRGVCDRGALGRWLLLSRLHGLDQRGER